MTGRTKAALVMLALLLLFPAVLWAEPPVGWQVTWNDYRTPLACVPVQYSQATIIWVYLPAEFLEGRSQVTLVYAVLSATMDSLDPRKMPTFNSCRPYLRIGEGMSSGIYDPSLDTDSAMLTIRLEVKTKHLRPGRNRIKAMCDSPPGIFCAADECRFYITKMYFKEAVASEEGGSQGEKQDLARQWAGSCVSKIVLQTILRSQARKELPERVHAEVDRILRSKDLDPLVEELTQALSERCHYDMLQVVFLLSKKEDAKDEPCMESFAAFLENLTKREMLLLREELKKKFPDL